jgi:type II secretory pathway pseudopilin PulG
MKRKLAAGFTYVGLLIAVALLGIALASAGTVWKTHAQREREAELMFVGQEYRNAIASYYRSGAGRQYPASLDDLLVDNRTPEPLHHLRKLYADPMTGAADWTLIAAPSLGIMGVASSSQAEPMKKDGFAPPEAAFKDKTCYCDWQFVYLPRNARRHRTAVPAAAD